MNKLFWFTVGCAPGAFIGYCIAKGIVFLTGIGDLSDIWFFAGLMGGSLGRMTEDRFA